MPNDVTHLRLYARWFYQERVRRETQYMIGKAYHIEQGHKNDYDKEKDHDCRGKVRKGIATAEQLLRLMV
jgi:hypothetical protein